MLKKLILKLFRLWRLWQVAGFAVLQVRDPQGGGTQVSVTGSGGAKTFLGFEIRGLGLFGLAIFWWTFFDRKILARTFLEFDQNDILLFSILYKTI